ncbi:MAG: hypothetical protein AB1374_05960 [Bacillota bacterium]
MATCRICGCTDERACPGGCYWVEPDLCSRCAERSDVDKGPEDLLRRDGVCCSCGKLLASSLHLNLVALNKRATWRYPVWDNMLLKPEHERIPRAVSVVCDKCVDGERIPAWAVEFRFGDSGRAEIVYHEVTDLQDVFEITDDMLLPVAPGRVYNRG